MKNMKRVLAALLSVAMLLAMAVPAFAAATGSYTISTASGDTHTYTVYQILTGTLAKDGDKSLGNVAAGKNFKTANAKGTDGANLDAAGAAAYFKDLTGTDQAVTDAVAEFVDTSTEAYGTVSDGKSLTGVPTGYYLIKDTTENMPEGDSYSTSLVKVVNNVIISPKKGTVTFEKKVDDINDTTGTAENLQDSADYDIGDAVPFTLTGTLPGNYASYSKYSYKFTDQMEKSLTFNKDSVKVYAVNGNTETDITDSFTISDGSTIQSGDFAQGTEFTVSIDDLKTINDATINASTKIVVKYNATLNSNANLGSQGNVNKAKLTYSNNPNKGGEGETGDTPWDNVIVFTYKVVVNKYANSVADGNKLAGAEFTLSKKLSNNSTRDIAVVKSDDGTSFSFSGLDDGTYVLTETKTPGGYNTISPITFTVTASHNITWDKQSRDAVLTSLSGNAASGEITFTADKTGDKFDGSLSTDVINKSGSTLPETGGIGTTIFYVVGGCMMFGAAVLLITKKRMENQ